MVDLLVIAGEHSGDNHAAHWVRQLKERHPQMHICAVGGPALKAAGAQLLFDLTQHAVVGLVEALKLLSGVSEIRFVYFSSTDVMRHPLVSKIIERYEGDQDAQN